MECDQSYGVVRWQLVSINKVALCWACLGLWMGKPSWCVTSHPGQLSQVVHQWLGALVQWVVVCGVGVIWWLIQEVICLPAAPCGSDCLLAGTLDGRIMHCSIISSCQSAATSEIVKHAGLESELCKEH